MPILTFLTFKIFYTHKNVYKKKSKMHNISPLKHRGALLSIRAVANGAWWIPKEQREMVSLKYSISNWLKVERLHPFLT